MLRRHLIALLVGLALLIGQLGGFAHAASHLKEGDKDRPHTVCELCVAYAALDAGAAAHVPPVTGEATQIAPDAPLPTGTGTASLPPYASRAPPSLA
ncbi:MAG: hypothetical protein AB1831_14455 [Pseudomonadota bacterium]